MNKAFSSFGGIFLACFALILPLSGCQINGSGKSPAKTPQAGGRVVIDESPAAYTEPSETDSENPMNGSAANSDNKNVPGEHTLQNFLQTAILPLGKTMYIWGGGWNEEDTGAGTDACTIGISPRWQEFSAMQNVSYDYKKYRYQIHDGLDCSGYVGWTVYNCLESESGRPGYVYKSTDTAKTYSELGLGTYLENKEIGSFLPGDIVSMKGHVWICLGSCEDGSVLLIHASPPGVRLCGTSEKASVKTQAVLLAERCMASFCPDWYEKYPDCLVDDDYLESSSCMRWNAQTFPDCETIQALSAEEIVSLLFP